MGVAGGGGGGGGGVGKEGVFWRMRPFQSVSFMIIS